MSFIITGKTAVDFMHQQRERSEKVDWRNATRDSKPNRTLEHTAKPTTEAVLRALESPLLHDLPKPLTFIVDSNEKRMKSKLATTSVRRTPLPNSSLVQIGKGIYCESPEFYLFKLLADSPLPLAVLHGYELCGGYMLPQNPKDEHIKCLPRTSMKALTKYIDQLQNESGTRKATRTLKYVKDNSWSPMESVTSTLFSLPVKHGGYGFKYFELNVPIATNSVERDLDPTHPPRYCDIYFNKARIDVEYDGDRWHQGEDNRARDDKRRNELEREGISVIVITKSIIQDVAEMNKIAAGIKKKAGRRNCPPSPENLVKRNELFELIVPGQIATINTNIRKHAVTP